MSGEPRLIRKDVEDYLRALALAVGKGQILELELKWTGGSEIDSKLRLAEPLHFVGLKVELDS